MARQSDETPRIDFSGCRRPELIAIASEQEQSLLDMRAVLYRETDALREELHMLQAENRALKEALSSMQEKSAHEPVAALDGDALKERLRPIVAKLLARHREETQALEQKLAALQTELAQEREKHGEKCQVDFHTICESEAQKPFLPFKQISRRFAQEEGVKPKAVPVPLYKLMPFVRDHK